MEREDASDEYEVYGADGDDDDDDDDDGGGGAFENSIPSPTSDEIWRKKCPEGANKTGSAYGGDDDDGGGSRKFLVLTGAFRSQSWSSGNVKIPSSKGRKINGGKGGAWRK